VYQSVLQDGLILFFRTPFSVLPITFDSDVQMSCSLMIWKANRMTYKYVSNIHRTFASLSRESITTIRKMASRNSWKNSGVIQRSDQKFMHFWAVTLVWHYETCSSPSSDSMLPHGKQLPETTVKIWERSNGRIKSYNPFELLLWSGETRPLLHWVEIL
jgi:hypothetical protein